MINLFDLSAGARVATRDGSPVRGTQSDRKDYADYNTVAGSIRRSSSDRSGGTPMKMLIAQEMAEGDTTHKTTSVVARLMGLDDEVALRRPLQPSSRRRSSEGHLSATMARVTNQMPFDKHTSFEENVAYKDVYEVGHQPSNDSSGRRRPHEDQDKKRMDLVRQKFIEAKQLASHENLLQSKEFHDALEILNSNKDLFLKFLEEPNSLFSKQSGEFSSAPTSPQRKRITVLKPAKSVEMKSEKTIKRQSNQSVNGSRTGKGNFDRKSNAGPARAERPRQHTRIVVLKPTSAITSVEQFQQNGHDSLDDSEAPVISRYLSDEINWSVHHMCNQHDESLQGCVESNMLSRNGSYPECAEEERSTFSESEVGTPTSPHSWDYIYRFSNPYFGSSLSHASCSPESLVAKDVKKHASSDRWPSASSNEISRENVLVRRSMSTLGEMLAMPDIKKEEIADPVPIITSNQSCSNEPRLAVPSNCSPDDMEGESSLRKISRSRSVPVNSSVFDSVRLDAGCSSSQPTESTTPKEVVKPKNGKSSIKGKISSFFSMRKKAGKEKLIPSSLETLNDIVLPSSNESVVNSGVSPLACTSLQEDVAVENLEENILFNEREAPFCSKAPIPLEKALSFEIRRSHFDQPSPTSVLDASFEDTSERSPSSLESAMIAKQEPLSRCLPIGSFARSLSWDDSSEEAALCSSKGDCHEDEHREFIEKILSSCGFCNEKTNDIFVQWHSLDCPLGPTVLDQFLEPKVEDAKCRERRSNQRLLIDSVNAALLDIGQSKLWGAYPCTGLNVNAQRAASGNGLVTDEVWRLAKGWLFDDEKNMVNGLDNAGLAADWVVRREIEGRTWPEMVRSEMDEMSAEICGEVLSELVGEAFSEFAGCH